MSDLSKQQLFTFLDWAGEKGLMKQSSSRSLKSACNAVLSVMDKEEARDLSTADLETVIKRYQNLHSLEVSPNTMQAYGKRVKYSVEEFLKYNDDKVGWKPSGGQRSTPSTQSSNKVKSSRRVSGKAVAKEPDSTHEVLDVSDITHQFPLRRDIVVTVKGIPFDVKRSEMARLNAFLSNLVATSEEQEPVPVMLNPPSVENSE